MYKNAFQGGEYVELLTAQGKNGVADLIACWQPSRPDIIIKEYDSLAKTYVFSIKGHPSSAVRITSPYDQRKSLSLTQQFLVIQLFVSQTDEFSFELDVSESATRSKLRMQFSTFYPSINCNSTVAKLPLAPLLKGVWLNVCVPLSSLVTSLWPGALYGSLDVISVCANCCVRRIFTMRSAPIDTSGFRDFHSEQFQYAPIPKQCQLQHGVQCLTQMLTCEALNQKVELAPLEKPPNGRVSTAKARMDRLKAEGLGLTNPARHKRKRNRLTSSAPSHLLPAAMKFADARQKLADLKEKSENRQTRSASLPRISSALSTSTTSTQSRSRTPSASKTNNNWRAYRKPKVPRDAWRGTSAYDNRRPPQPPPLLRHTRPKTTEIRKAESPPAASTEDDADLKNQVEILHERLNEVIEGPDETVHYSDSEDEMKVTTKEGISHAVSIDPNRFIRPNHSAVRQRPIIHKKARSVSFDVASRLEAIMASDQYALELRAKPEPEIEPEVEESPPMEYEKIAALMDFDEAALLASLRRSHLNGSLDYRTSDRPARSLSKHAFDDDSDTDEEFQWSVEPPPGWNRGISPALMEMGKIDLKSSLSDSLLSTKLRDMTIESMDQGRRPQNGHYKSIVEEGVDLHYREDSGVDSVEDDGTCPALDLMFDPELNCYYHPITKEYYQVASS